MLMTVHEIIRRLRAARKILDAYQAKHGPLRAHPRVCLACGDWFPSTEGLGGLRYHMEGCRDAKRLLAQPL